MKKIQIKRIFILTMCVALLGSLSPTSVKAEIEMFYPYGEDWLKESVNYAKTQTIYCSPKDDKSYNNLLECLFPLKKNISVKKIKNIKSSNPKVLKIDNVHSGTTRNSKKKAVVLSAYMRKPGKATVSFKYNKKTYKINYVVKKFSNGIKSLNMGGYSQNFASKFNSRVAYEVNGKKRPSNIQIKMKNNWVVTEVYLVSSEIRGFEKTIFSSKKGKSNVTVKDKSFNSADLYISIYCQNKKTGEEEVYHLNFEIVL